MDLLPTEEQQQIIDTAANFLAHEFPVKHLLKLTDNTTPFTRSHLQHIASMGWIGIGLPEDYDGVGYGLAEEALLFVELGRNLMPPSVLASVLAAHVAAQSGTHGVPASDTRGRGKDSPGKRPSCTAPAYRRID